MPDILLLVQRMESEFEELTIQDIRAIEQRAQEDFEKVGLHIIKAGFHYLNLDIDECAEECRAVLRIIHHHMFSHYLLALCLALREQYREAVPHFKRVLAVKEY